MRPRLALAMAASKTRFVFSDAALDRLGRTCDILTPAPLEDLSTPDARVVLQNTDILVTGWGSPFISRDLISAAPNLKLIAHAAGTVKYHLDPVVFDAGIAVTNAVAANALPVAEFTLAMIILANKQVFRFRDLYRADPSRSSSHALMDTPIGNYTRTIGIVGASHIGRRVIDLLAPFDYTTLLYDPHVSASDEIAKRAELVPLDELLARSDVVSLHAPSLPSTKHMIGVRELRLMQIGATLLYTARGALVDEAALLSELQTGRIAAVIDVTDPEIPPPDSAFFTLPNVFLTPHIAGAAGSERSRLGDLVVDEIERFVAGRPLRHQVQAALLRQLA